MEILLNSFSLWFRGENRVSILVLYKGAFPGTRNVLKWNWLPIIGSIFIGRVETELSYLASKDIFKRIILFNGKDTSKIIFSFVSLWLCGANVLYEVRAIAATIYMAELNRFCWVAAFVLLQFLSQAACNKILSSSCTWIFTIQDPLESKLFICSLLVCFPTGLLSSHTIHITIHAYV